MLDGFNMLAWISSFLGVDFVPTIELNTPYGMLMMTVACFFLMYALVMVLHIFVRALLYFMNMGWR